MTENKTTLEEWLEAVDIAVVAKCGLGRDDLPDAPYADWYEEGVTPKSAAARAVRRAKNGD